MFLVVEPEPPNLLRRKLFSSKDKIFKKNIEAGGYPDLSGSTTKKKKNLPSLREDTHKKMIFLVVGPLGEGRGVKMLQTYIHTYRHTDIRHTDPPTKRILEEHSLLKIGNLSFFI